MFNTRSMMGSPVAMSTVVPFRPAADSKRKNVAPEYRVLNKGGARGEIWLYGMIGHDWFGDGVSASQFAKDLKALGAVDFIDLHINSEGGLVTDGRAMYNLLVEHKAKVHVHIDGLAASAASFIAMAGDEINIAEGAFVMIHDARMGCYGTEADMNRGAAILREVNTTIRETYVARTGNSDAQVRKWMEDETWFSGKDAVKNNFADKIIENMTVAAATIHVPTMFNRLPTDLQRPRKARAAAAMAEMKQLAASK